MHAAPPLMIDLTKMPRSAWFSLERFPLTLTPNPAEPESLRGISKVRNSLVPSGVRTSSSSSVFCKRVKTKTGTVQILEKMKAALVTNACLMTPSKGIGALIAEESSASPVPVG